jgi:hypothetical protein
LYLFRARSKIKPKENIRGTKMKWYKLVKDYQDIYKKGTKFFVISESEFIGVKEFVLQTKNLDGKIIISEKELKEHFKSIKIFKREKLDS